MIKRSECLFIFRTYQPCARFPRSEDKYILLNIAMTVGLQITSFSDGCDNGNIFHDGRRTISPIVVVIPIIIIIPLDDR